MALLTSIGSTLADTSTDTGISVTLENNGHLAVSFSPMPGGYAFTNASGGTTFNISAIQGNTATAWLRLTWTDDRLSDDRLPFQLVLSASDLDSSVSRPDGKGAYSIPAANLSIVRLGDEQLASPLNMGQQHTIFSSSSQPPSGEASLDIQLKLAIPASAYPTSYATILRIEVNQIGSGI